MSQQTSMFQFKELSKPKTEKITSGVATNGIKFNLQQDEPTFFGTGSSKKNVQIQTN